MELTECVCEYDDHREREPDCYHAYRADVVVLVAAAGWTGPGAVVRERYAVGSRTTVAE